MDSKFTCNICFEKYDKSFRQPIILMFCGHTFCSQCINELKQQKYLCPTCRETIVREKTNFALLEALDDLETSHLSQEQMEKVEDKLISSDKLKIPDKTKNENDKEISEDLSQKAFQSFYGFSRKKCENCSEYDLCHECQIVSKDVQSTTKDDIDCSKLKSQPLFRTPNHPHMFLEKATDNEWFCRGETLFGKCKSSRLKTRNLQIRYECDTCLDYNLCHECIAAPLDKEFQTPNHPHGFSLNDLNDGWCCDGGLLFGKCKSGFEDSYKSKGSLRYTCKTCLAFDAQIKSI